MLDRRAVVYVTTEGLRRPLLRRQKTVCPPSGLSHRARRVSDAGDGALMSQAAMRKPGPSPSRDPTGQHRRYARCRPSELLRSERSVAVDDSRSDSAASMARTSPPRIVASSARRDEVGVRAGVGHRRVVVGGECVLGQPDPAPVAWDSAGGSDGCLEAASRSPVRDVVAPLGTRPPGAAVSGAAWPVGEGAADEARLR